MTRYPELPLIIGGTRRMTGSVGTLDIENPASGEIIATTPAAGAQEAVEAAALASEGFAEWSALSPLARSQTMRRAADLMRERTQSAATAMTLEQGKPIQQARLEWNASADLLDWYAEEGRRVYGRIVPSRSPGISLAVHHRPLGPVAAFAPWNFPAWAVMQKIAPALGAGCSIVVKPSEGTPATAMLIAEALLEAGLPPKAISVVWGPPAPISEALISHPAIRKISLTGSIPVGRLLSKMAGEHLKKTTMELGGHAPVIVMADADLDDLVPQAVQWKFRNAGQVCVSPTRFLVDEAIHDEFVERATAETKKLTLGNGLDAGTDVGPVMNARRLAAIEALVDDARDKGAVCTTGGTRVGNQGHFFEPTVLSGMTPDMLAMNEEPFGPLMLVSKTISLGDALSEANRLPVGLASYCFSQTQSNVFRVSQTIQAGMLGVNHFALALPETPFGGILDSGFGSEGGTEGIAPYLSSHLVTARLV